MFYWIVKAFLRPLLCLLFRPKVVGRHHVPSQGGAILASNHLSMCDSLFLPAMTRRRVCFLAKQEYFTGRGVRGRAKAAFVRATGLIPLDRTNPDAAAVALSAGARYVKRGGLLCVYPEGTRRPDGRLYRGKSGVARLAMSVEVPIVPIAMIGTDRVQPIGRILPHLARVEISIGRAIPPPKSHGDTSQERMQAREYTDSVMAAIQTMSGQQYTDTDARSYKSKAIEALSA